MGLGVLVEHGKSKSEEVMRNQALDIMKAMGIFLVIIGHNISSGVPYHYIYSFHMPLFFIIAGYLWKERSVGQSLWHDFKRIMMPYITYLVLAALADCICNGVSIGRIEQDLLAIVWGSVVKVDILGHHVQGIGYIWFLPALYVCKNVFNAMYKLWKHIGFKVTCSYVCMYVCMGVGIVIHHRLFPLPFAITTGLNALGYFCIGQLMQVWFKDIEVLNRIAWWYKLIIVAVYVSIGWYTLNGMGTCDYSILPLDYIAGISGTIMCYYLAVWMQKSTKYVRKWMTRIGQYTISILIIHQFVASYAWVIHIDNQHFLLITMTIGIAMLYVLVHSIISEQIVKCRNV